MATTELVRRIGIGCMFLAAYVALDYLSYLKPYGGFGITPWNPPPGLSITLTFLGGLFYAPFVLLAPLAADAFVRGMPLGTMPEVVYSIATGGAYLLAGLVLQRRSAFDPRFRSPRDATTFLAVSLLAVAAASGASVVVLLAAHAIERSEMSAVAWRGAIGDFIGILVTVPLLLLAHIHRPWPAPSMRSLWQLVSLLAALAVVFGYRDATAFQLFYLLFLPVLWVALSDGPPGTVVALLLVQLGLVFGAEVRFGVEPGLGALQALMVALAATGLVVSAVVAERQDTAARLREHQAALDRALRVRSAGEVAATIAHEINQPLTALNTYAGMARNAIGDGQAETAAQLLEKIASESARAATVLKSIRELLRQGTLTRTPMDLRDVLGELEHLLKDDLEKRGIALTIAVDRTFPVILADRIQLEQAIHNLVVNSSEAIEAVGRAGNVLVSATVSGSNTCSIEVSDDGPGFPPGYDTGAPTPFMTTKPGGSGIGLGVARSIAEAHGGSMSISSSSRGAKVTLRIPIQEA